MKSFALIVFLGTLRCYSGEVFEANKNISRNSRIAIDTNGLCTPGNVGSTHCEDSDTCRTGTAPNRARYYLCDANNAAILKKCELDEYCNEQVRGKATCVKTRNFGCPLIPTRACTGDASSANKKFCDNNNPCVSTKIITCNYAGAYNPLVLPFDCKNSGFVGCIETLGGDAKCVRELPYYCSKAATQFVCTGTGTYPHPTNCNRYYQCTSDGAIGVVKECPMPQVFDPMVNKNGNPCKINKGSDCVTAQCGNGNLAVLMNYPNFAKNSGSYAASCISPQSVYRCEDGFTPDLNTGMLPITCTGSCNPGIPKAIDPSNQRAYYKCNYNGFMYVGSSVPCDFGRVYVAATKQCVVG